MSGFMEILPAQKFPERDAAAFAAFLGYCREAAERKGRPQLASVSLRVRHIDPLAVLQSIYEPGQLHGYLERPQADEAIAGAEAVLSQTASGSGRFAALRDFSREVLDNTIAIGDLDAPLAGPYFFCAFAFEKEVAEDAAFPSARAFVPLWQVARRGGECVAVANVLVTPDSPVELLARRVLAAHGKFSVFDYAGIPEPGAAPKVVETAEARPEAFEAGVSEALGRIGADRYEKIVLARAVDVRADRPFQPLETVNRLRERFPACHCFSFANGRGGSFIGATPERLARVRGGVLETEAIAGSAARGEGAREDARLAAALLASEKDHREHQHVVASIRQRLEALGLTIETAAEPGLVKLANVQHLRTPVRAELENGLHLLDVAAALHPTPAVGGRPREQAVPDIAGLEGFARGLFAGALGGFDHRGEGELVVGIRSGFFQAERARLFAGAGIVAGSEPAREKLETDMKLRAMLEAIQ